MDNRKFMKQQNVPLEHAKNSHGKAKKLAKRCAHYIYREQRKAGIYVDKNTYRYGTWQTNKL